VHIVHDNVHNNVVHNVQSLGIITICNYAKYQGGALHIVHDNVHDLSGVHRHGVTDIVSAIVSTVALVSCVITDGYDTRPGDIVSAIVTEQCAGLCVSPTHGLPDSGQHDFRVLVSDGEQNPCGSPGRSPALFPIS
jgi:hypothetical protein